MSRVALDYKPQARQVSHARWFIAGVLAPLSVAVLVYFSLDQGRPPPRSAEGIELAMPLQEPLIQTVEISPPPIPAPLGDTVEFVVRRNDTLDRIFRRLELSLHDLAAIRGLPAVKNSLDRLTTGETITVTHMEGALQTLRRRISESEILNVRRNENGFTVEVVATPVSIREVAVHGTVDSSLFVSARAAGMAPDLIMQLANEIFGWEIDFALDIQRGDQFSIVYEQKFRDGEYIGNGRILAAEFINNGVTHRALLFKSSDGQINDYFAADGRSMRRQFLRAPLDFTRISSHFNPRRRHPILNTIRAHKGVDYAAATGTVIKAAGDGRVAFVGTKGGYGRVVILEHGGGISTLYGHMSRFAKGMRVGSRVKQGAVVGYVGSSGAATGPHLHYEYRVNGQHKNPRTVPLPEAGPIAPSYVAEFQARAATLFANLDKARDAAVAAVPARD